MASADLLVGIPLIHSLLLSTDGTTPMYLFGRIWLKNEKFIDYFDIIFLDIWLDEIIIESWKIGIQFQFYKHFISETQIYAIYWKDVYKVSLVDRHSGIR